MEQLQRGRPRAAAAALRCLQDGRNRRHSGPYRVCRALSHRTGAHAAPAAADAGKTSVPPFGRGKGVDPPRDFGRKGEPVLQHGHARAGDRSARRSAGRAPFYRQGRLLCVQRRGDPADGARAAGCAALDGGRQYGLYLRPGGERLCGVPAAAAPEKRRRGGDRRAAQGQADQPAAQSAGQPGPRGRSRRVPARLPLRRGRRRSLQPTGAGDGKRAADGAGRGRRAPCHGCAGCLRFPHERRTGNAAGTRPDLALFHRRAGAAAGMLRGLAVGGVPSHAPAQGVAVRAARRARRRHAAGAAAGRAAL